MLAALLHFRGKVPITPLFECIVPYKFLLVKRLNMRFCLKKRFNKGSVIKKSVNCVTDDFSFGKIGFSLADG